MGKLYWEFLKTNGREVERNQAAVTEKEFKSKDMERVLLFSC